LMIEKSHAREAKGGISFADESGKLLSGDEVEEYHQHIERRIKERTEKMDKIERCSKVKYFLHKWMFVAGLVLLFVSRAINLCSSQLAPAA